MGTITEQSTAFQIYIMAQIMLDTNRPAMRSKAILYVKLYDRENRGEYFQPLEM